MAIAMQDAVRIAKTQAQQLFEGDDMAHLMLEEVDFDEAKQVWLVTLGYDSHQVIKTTKGGLPLFPSTETTEEKRLRIYKTFQIDASDGRLISMKMRDV
jgi:hypothetical protein